MRARSVLRTAVACVLLCLSSAVASAQSTVRRTYQDEGWKAIRAAKYDEAERLFRAAIKEAEATSTSDALLGHHLRGLAITLANAGRTAEVDALLRRAHSLAQTHEPNSNNYALILVDIADREGGKPNYPEALRLYQEAEATALRQTTINYGTLAAALSGIGRVHVAQSRFAEAEPYLKRAIEAVEKDPDRTPGMTAGHLSQLASLYYTVGRYAEADPLVRRALTIREQAYGGEHPDVASSLHTLGMLAVARGNGVEAMALYTRSLAIQEKVYGPDNIQLSGTLNNLANIHTREGRYTEAEALHRRSLRMRETARGANHPSVALALSNIADILVIQEKYVEAKPLLDRVLAIREKALGPETTEVAAALDSLAWWHAEQLQFAAAEPLYRRSLAIREKVYGPSHQFTSGSLRGLALTRSVLGTPDEAATLLRRANERSRAAKPEGNRGDAVAASKAGDAHAAAGRLTDAKQQYSRAAGLYITAGGPDDPGAIESLKKLAGVYDRQGKPTLGAFYRLRAATR